MSKIFLMISLITNSISYTYLNIDSIEYYYDYRDKLTFIFNISSDYVSTHLIDVEFDFYKSL